MRDFAFTGGRPDPGTFPTQELITASAKALEKIGSDLVNYPGEDPPPPPTHTPAERGYLCPWTTFH